MEPTLREVKKRRTRDAIVACALKLFTSNGYDAVTIAAVARAAGVGERTVYRYFADKEEMLFAEDDEMRTALGTATAAQPVNSNSIEIVRAAACAVATLLEQQRPQIQQRAAVIKSTPALRAREGVKQAGHQQLISDELARRGLPPERARLVGAVGVVCFNEGLTRWLAGHDNASLHDKIADAFDELLDPGP